MKEGLRQGQVNEVTEGNAEKEEVAKVLEFPTTITSKLEELRAAIHAMAGDGVNGNAKWSAEQVGALQTMWDVACQNFDSFVLCPVVLEATDTDDGYRVLPGVVGCGNPYALAQGIAQWAVGNGVAQALMLALLKEAGINQPM